MLPITVLFAMASALTSTIDESDRATPIPGCGVASTYSLLRCRGLDVTLQQVTECFRAANPTFESSAVSIADVRCALDSFGVQTRAERIQSSALTSLPTPCILFIRPGRWPRSPSGVRIGHFVTLVRFVEDRAVLLDWSGTSVEAAIHLPTAELAKHWDGEVILTQEPWLARAALAIGFTLVACQLAFWRFTKSRTIQAAARSEPSVTALVVIALCCTGCGSAPPPAKVTTPTLVFDEPLWRAGRVPSGRMIERKFRFRVWDRNPIKISQVITSCGCTNVSQDIVGKELPPGSEHELSVIVRPDTEGRTETQMIKILTDPASAVPLAVGVQYQRQDSPRLSVSRVISRALPGSIPEAQLIVTYRRGPTDSQVPVDRSKCASTHFDVVDVIESSEVVLLNPTSQDKVAVDSTTVKLRGRQPWSYGRHPGTLQLAFGDGSIQTLPTEIQIPHPCQPQLPRVFCGVLEPGQSWTVSIPYVRDSSVAFEVASIRPSDETVQAKILPDRFEVSGRAPQTPGRFASELIVTFHPESIPPLKLPVTGVVSQK